MRLSAPTVVQICKICTAKLAKQNDAVSFRSMFRNEDCGVLRELGTERVHQDLRTSLSIRNICGSDARVTNMFCIVFKTKELSLTYIIAGLNIQIHQEGQKSMFANLLHAPTEFETVFYIFYIVFVA